VQQVLLISYTNYWRGPDLVDPAGVYAGGWEYNVTLALLALTLLCFGPGRVAIDRLFHRPKNAETEEDTETGSSTAGTSSMVSASSSW
jgi:putative oxidoreductase